MSKELLIGYAQRRIRELGIGDKVQVREIVREFGDLKFYDLELTWMSLDSRSAATLQYVWSANRAARRWVEQQLQRHIGAGRFLK